MCDPTDEAPVKMVSHNNLLNADEGGETAFIKAAEMGISLVRFDFRWHQLTTDEGWMWDSPGPNRWTEVLEPSLRWTKEHGMRTLVNLLTYKPRSESLEAMNTAWEAHSGSRRTLDARHSALWAAWAAKHGVDPGAPSPRDFAEALVDKLAEGQASEDWAIEGFCVLNEPNTCWPAEWNWKKLKIGPGEVYTTADHCSDLCDWVKARARTAHGGALDQAVTVINLHSYRRHWKAQAWRSVAANPNLDRLGIDIYWDQIWGLFAWGKPRAMRAVAEEHGKQWWLVETAGADGPGLLLRNPSCWKVRKVTEQCRAEGAKVLGYYRLWGDVPGPLDFSSAYCILTNPGNAPVPREDGRGERFCETIRDL